MRKMTERTKLDRRGPGWLGALALVAVTSAITPCIAFAGPEELFCSVDAALFGDEQVVLTGGSRVYADAPVGDPAAAVRVASNQSIALSGNASIHGDAISGGRVTRVGAASITGTITENAALVSLPNLDAQMAWYRAHNDDHTIPLTDRGRAALVRGTDLLLTGRDNLYLFGGDYYFTGVTLSGGSKLTLLGPVRLFVDGGKADFSGGAVVNTSGNPEDLLVFVGCAGSRSCSVKVSGNSNFHGGVLAPTGTVEVTGTGDFHGAIVARRAGLTGGARFHSHPLCPPPDDDVDPDDSIPR